MCTMLFLEKQHSFAYACVTEKLYYKKVHCSAPVFSKRMYMRAVTGEKLKAI